MSEQDNPAGQASAPDGNGDGTSRRMFMVGGAAAALGAAAVGAAAIGRARSSGKVTDNQARLLDKITASATGAASLSDVRCRCGLAATLGDGAKQSLARASASEAVREGSNRAT